jgi:hypothetical protein
MRSGRCIPHFAVALNPVAKEREETFAAFVRRRGRGGRRPSVL